MTGGRPTTWGAHAFDIQCRCRQCQRPAPTRLPRTDPAEPTEQEPVMDPGTGRLYQSLTDAKAAGVEHPVLVSGRPQDIERISEAVAVAWTSEQKTARNTKGKRARAARRNNRN